MQVNGCSRNTESASHENLLLIAVRAMPAKIDSEAELSKGDLWVFGYGSLMWRPGFEFIQQGPARLIRQHRALFAYSFDHRPTPETPPPPPSPPPRRASPLPPSPVPATPR